MSEVSENGKVLRVHGERNTRTVRNMSTKAQEMRDFYEYIVVQPMVLSPARTNFYSFSRNPPFGYSLSYINMETLTGSRVNRAAPRCFRAGRAVNPAIKATRCAMAKRVKC